MASAFSFLLLSMMSDLFFLICGMQMKWAIVSYTSHFSLVGMGLFREI